MMKFPDTHKFPPAQQYLISIAVVVLISIVCFFTAFWMGYRAVALILLITVSVLAMLFDIKPVLAAAVLSAFIWNFFFIPPLFTLHIDKVEDVLMFLAYFIVAMVNAVLTSRIRKAELRARDVEEREKAIRLYDTLLNSLSHELRTPISAIFGAVGTLKENQDRLTPANMQDLLSVLDKASIQLNRQVENLLNMSRLESGMLKLNPDWCDLNELIHSVMQKFSPAGDRRMQFKTNEDLPYFKLDAGLLEQVLHNLIHNAVHYTPDDSMVEIQAFQRNDHLVITVRDHGQGFPEESVPLVFEKFYRLPLTKPGGSGLGLSIVKGFVEAHNGTVVLDNLPTGARFTIEIPAESSHLNKLKHD